MGENCFVNIEIDISQKLTLFSKVKSVLRTGENCGYWAVAVTLIMPY